MPTSRAHVPTDRAARYLAQLCRHGSRMTGMHGRPPHVHQDGQAPPRIRHAQWSETRGVLDFGFGTCTLDAGPEGLTLHAQSPDEQGLRRLQDGIAARVEKIGRRDGLHVVWDRPQPPATAPEGAPGPADEPPAARSPLRTYGTRAGTAAVAVVVLAVHLGVGRALLDASWTWWTLAAVLGVLALKAVAVGAVVLRRRRP